MKITLLIFALLLYKFVFCQSLERNVLATTGSTFGNSTLSINFTIGETLTSTLTNQNLIITQGFQQASKFKLAIEGPIYTIGVNDNEMNGSPWLYPNPATDQIQISHSFQNPFSWKLIDYLGRIIDYGTSSQALLFLNIQNLATGSYSVLLESNSTNYSLPFIKN